MKFQEILKKHSKHFNRMRLNEYVEAMKEAYNAGISNSKNEILYKKQYFKDTGDTRFLDKLKK